MTIETCYSPELIPLYNLENKIVVVVDIFRATSSMVAGLSAGVPHIIPVADKEKCLPYKAQNYILAGERNGEKIADFDIGNSPVGFTKIAQKKQPICMSTTNGTKAISLSLSAKEVLIGAFLNLDVIAEYLKNKQQNIVIFCAGWKGKYSLEDTLFAGALTAKITTKNTVLCDASLAAEVLYDAAKSNIYRFLLQSSHAQRLGNLDNQNDIYEDIQFCCTLNKFDKTVVFQNGRLLLN